MNKIHRTVWSATRQAYVVAHEKAATRGKPSSTQKVIVEAVAIGLMAIASNNLFAAACPATISADQGFCEMTTSIVIDSGVTVTGGHPTTAGYGILVSTGITGSITNNGVITNTIALGAGIRINSGTALDGAITNNGEISTTDDSAIVIDGTLTGGLINNGGALISGTMGIRAFDAVIGTGLTNSGTIRGDIGVYLGGGTSYWTSGTAPGITTISGAIRNSGTIEGSNGQGILIEGGIVSSIVNENNATISGTAEGIKIAKRNWEVWGATSSSGSTLISSGSFRSSVTGGITNSGSILGGTYGILIEGSDITSGITNSGSGRIIAQGASSTDEIIGLYVYANSSVGGGITNSGQIIATNTDVAALAYGIAIRTSNVSGGIHNLSGGTISGGGGGIFMQGSASLDGGITNSGLIEGTGGIGIIVSNSSLTGGISNLNGGRIVGGNSIAISINSPTPVTVTNASGGTIVGGMFANTVWGAYNSVAVDVINNGLWHMTEDPMAPNNYIGSYISGNFVQGSTGTLKIGAYGTGAGEYTQIGVKGSATLDGTLDIDVKAGSPLTQGNTLAAVIHADGGISGTFASITDNSTLFDFAGVYGANDFDLTIAAASTTGVLTAVTSTGNTPATGAASALDNIITSDPTGSIATLFQGFTTQQQVSNAVSQTLPLLTGGSQVAASAALTGMNRVVQARIESNRGLSSGDSFYGDQKFWMKPFGSWADQNDRKGVSGYYAKTGGLAFGADATISPTTRLGLSFAYAKASVDGNSRIAPNAANVDVYQLIGYGSYSFDADTEANFQVGYGQNKNQGHRDLLAFGLRAKASYDSQVFTAGAGVGHTYKLSEQTSFTPSVRADYTWIKDDSYTETGAGALNLNVKGRSTDELILAVDGKVSHEIEKGLILNANLGLGYDALNAQSSITAAYAGAPGAAFTTKGLDPSPWLVRGGLGIVSTTQSGMEVSARYDAEYRQDFLNQTASVKLRWAF